MNTFSRKSYSNEKTLWPQPTTLRGSFRITNGPVPQVDTTAASQFSYTRVFASGDSFQDVCEASWSRWFRSALFRAVCLSLRLTLCGKFFATPKIFIFAVIISHTSLYGDWLAVNTSHVQMPPNLTKLLPCSRQTFAFCILLCVWVSIFIQEMKIAEEKINKIISAANDWG